MPRKIGRVSDAELREEIAGLVARDAIRQLVYRYAWSMDSRDLDAVVTLFVDDVRVNAQERGRAALRATLGAQLHSIGPTTLMVGNHIIDLDAHDRNRAAGIVYCRAYIEEPHGFVEQMIVYHDRYRRGPDGMWLFVGRRHELFYGITTAEQPHRQGPANWPERSTGVGTLPFRLESWQKFRNHG